MGKVVGIDLGTTSSRVAFVQCGVPVIIENTEGEGTTPSYVAITPNGDRLVGEAARRYSVHDQKNVAFAVKRLIGRKFSDPIVQEIARYVPYEIVETPNGDAGVRLNGQDFSPIQLSAFVLQTMKQTAESFFGDPVTQAVITVPAYFNDSQRRATKEAAKIAGLEVLRIINEPTAAALAYGLDKKSRTATIAVYDLGGGTFDISILFIGDGVFEVMSTRGDMHLGGEDIDYRLVEYLAQEFEKDHGVDLLANDNARQRLKQAAEQAKIELSSQQKSLIDLPFIHFDGQSPTHLRKTITRPLFDSLIDDLVKRSIKVCADALKRAGEKDVDGRPTELPPYEIDQVVLVGGSTRIPSIQSALQQYFKRPLFGGLRREDAVALGAAIQAGVLKGDVKDVLLLDSIPMSLGVEIHGGLLARIIERDTTFPTKRGVTFTAVGECPDAFLATCSKAEIEDLGNSKVAPIYPDRDGAILVRILQGDSEKAFENETLGRFVLSGIPRAPRRLPRIALTFDMDANGIVHAGAEDIYTTQNASIRVQASTGADDRQIDAMIEDTKSRPVVSREIRQAVKLGVERPALRRESESEPPKVSAAQHAPGRASDSAARAGLFVSYAHEDKEWARHLEKALAILTRQGRIDLFIDHHMRSGEDWRQRIFQAIENASAAILFLSNDFFSSDFIMAVELPMVLAEHERRGLSLVPVVIRPCPFDLHDVVAKFQAFNNPNTPLSTLAAWQIDAEFSRLARELAKAGRSASGE